MPHEAPDGGIVSELRTTHDRKQALGPSLRVSVPGEVLAWHTAQRRVCTLWSVEDTHSFISIASRVENAPPVPEPAWWPQNEQTGFHTML